MLSDSESSDSDSGIRFKTASTRHRDGSSFSSYSSLREELVDKRSSVIDSGRHRYNDRDRDHRSLSRERKRSRSRDSKKKSRKRDKSKEHHKSHRRKSIEKCAESREKSSSSVRTITGTSANSRLDKNSPSGSGDSIIKLEKLRNTDKSKEIPKTSSSSSSPQKDRIYINTKTDTESRRTESATKSKRENIPGSTRSVKSDIKIPTAEELAFGPALPPHLQNNVPSKVIKNSSSDVSSSSKSEIKINESISKRESGGDICGPALPPHMVTTTNKSLPEKKVVGPSLPSQLTQLQPEDVSSDSLEDDDDDDNDIQEQHIISDDDDDDDISCVGPLPLGSNMSTAQLELEKRALELKLAKLEGSNSSSTKSKVREEWMLELPEVNSLKSLGPTARQFRAKEGPDFSDRSSWTDTPHEKERKKHKPPSEKEKKESIQEHAQYLYDKKRDAQQEKMAKKHKKKHKRDESLLDMHKKKLKKLKKEEAKKSETQERRPFSREVDLKVNRFDQAQTNSIIKKAQLLDTRFSSGKTKYL